MSRKFQIIITREGAEYVARCSEMPDAVARGTSVKEATEKIKVIIRKKLDDGSDGGTAPKQSPVAPHPPGPVAAAASINPASPSKRL